MTPVTNEMRIDPCVTTTDANSIRRAFLFAVSEILNKTFLLHFKGVFVYKNVSALHIINHILLGFFVREHTTKNKMLHR